MNGGDLIKLVASPSSPFPSPLLSPPPIIIIIIIVSICSSSDCLKFLSYVFSVRDSAQLSSFSALSAVIVSFRFLFFFFDLSSSFIIIYSSFLFYPFLFCSSSLHALALKLAWSVKLSLCIIWQSSEFVLN